jgi:hypothetical protein
MKTNHKLCQVHLYGKYHFFGRGKQNFNISTNRVHIISGIQNAQNGNLQTFPLVTARLVFVKGLLIVNTVSSLMSIIT